MDAQHHTYAKHHVDAQHHTYTEQYMDVYANADGDEYSSGASLRSLVERGRCAVCG